MVEETLTTPVAAGLAVLIPVKAFAVAKLRLADVLVPARRAELARQMATTVLRAAGDVPAAVVCDDEEVRSWAHGHGAEVIWTPGLGLNGAVEAGVTHLARRGATRVIVAHADLPLARDLAWVGHFGGITLVPDRHGDGTNVVSVPAAAGFRFSYGGGSFARHRATATRSGLPVRIVPDVALGWDVDVPDDLNLPGGVDLLAPPPRSPSPAEAPCR